MKKRLFIIYLILFSLAVAACAPKAETPNSGWKTYQNDALGVSFDLPETWVSQDANGVITIAVNQESLDNQISSGAGASITLASARDFDGFSDPVDILGLFMEYIESGRADLERIEEPEIITIRDQPASTISYRGKIREQNGLFKATIISNDENIALILTVDGSEGEEYQETLERITQSILVFKPAE